MADERPRKLAGKGPTLLQRSHTSADTHLHCVSEHFSNCFSPSPPAYRLLSSLTCIRSSSIFAIRPTPNDQSTDALRTHARCDKFAARPAGFELLPPDKLWSPSKNLPRRLGSRSAFGTLRASVNRIRGKSKTRS